MSELAEIVIARAIEQYLSDSILKLLAKNTDIESHYSSFSLLNCLSQLEA